MEKATKKKAVIIFSGGLDTTTVLAYAESEGFECYLLTFAYGQRHLVEVDAAKKVAKNLGVSEYHHIMTFPPEMFGRSALTREDILVPDYEPERKDIPVTYVPARNTIFLSVALGYAEDIGASDIFLGISYVDYSNYPDCRPEYMEAFEKMANLGTKAAVEGKPFKIHAPLMYLSKAETIKLGVSLGVDYSLSISCYRADSQTGAACGTCDSCVFRKKGFAEAGVSDPTLYIEVS